MQQAQRAELVFDGTKVSAIVDAAGHPWLTASQVADVLGMRRLEDLFDLFDEFQDEFTPEMTQVVTLDGGQCERVFSPRGCHLVGLLADTDKSKAFRRWVLDVLEQVHLQQPETMEQERPRKLAFRLGVHCWKCGSRGTSGKQIQVTPILIESTYSCTNPMCGHTWVAAIEAVRTLNPGAYPNPPGVAVPLSKHVRRADLMAQLEHLPEAASSALEDAIPRPPEQLDLLEAHGP